MLEQAPKDLRPPVRCLRGLKGPAHTGRNLSSAASPALSSATEVSPLPVALVRGYRTRYRPTRLPWRRAKRRQAERGEATMSLSVDSQLYSIAYSSHFSGT